MAYVQIDIEDYIDELSTEDLLEELKRRKVEPPVVLSEDSFDTIKAELLSAFKAADKTHFDVMLGRLQPAAEH